MQQMPQLNGQTQIFKKGKIDIMITTRDRHSELALLLQSLRTQRYQNFDIFLLDDSSGTAINNCYFIMKLIAQLKLEGHKVVVIRNEISMGVCAARNKLREVQQKKGIGEYTARLDDDVIIDADYLEKLLQVIDAGYDVASGITPPIAGMEWKRETRFVEPIINRHEFDKEGNITMRKDDCGYGYISDTIITTHQFRSCALMKREVSDKIGYEENLTPVGFREELFYSFRAILAGYKIGVHTGAKAWHLQTPSGGTRSQQQYNADVMLDQETADKWCKKQYEKHGNFLEVKE